MRVGDAVLVVPLWSSFHGMRGTVVETRPYLMITLEGDTFPMRFGEREVQVVEPPQHIGGAE